jgi:hypothetical protein
MGCAATPIPACIECGAPGGVWRTFPDRSGPYCFECLDANLTPRQRARLLARRAVLALFHRSAQRDVNDALERERPIFGSGEGQSG